MYIYIYIYICIVPRNLQRSDPIEQTPKKPEDLLSLDRNLLNFGPLVKSHSIFDGSVWFPLNGQLNDPCLATNGIGMSCTPTQQGQFKIKTHYCRWRFKKESQPLEADSKGLKILSKPRPCDNMIYHLCIYI